MTNRRKAPSSYREPPAAEPPQRRGLLDRFLAPRAPASSPMPKLRYTIARGAITVLSVPQMLVAVPLVLFAIWVVFTSFGFEGPFSTMSSTFALPSTTSLIDTQIAGTTFRPAVDAMGFAANAGTLAAILGLIVFHGAVNALVTTLSVEQLRTGAVSSWAVRRAGHVIRTTIAVGFMSLGLLIVGRILAQLLGGLGVVFGLFGSMVIGVYLFGFAPAIDADEDRRLTDTLTRSVRAGRMPGSANLWLAILYIVVWFVSVLAPLPGSGIGVTPSIAAWATVIVLSIGHLVMQATLAYRYLAVAHEVPEQPPERLASRRR